MAKTGLRFYIAESIIKSEEFKAQLTKGAGSDMYVSHNYVQFSGDFLHLDSLSFLSQELIDYLNGLTDKVTLLVNTVEPEKLIKGLQGYREFFLNFPDVKISGNKGVAGSCDLLISGNSFEKVSETFKAFVPQMFPQTDFLFIPYLKGMRLWEKLRIVFGW